MANITFSGRSLASSEQARSVRLVDSEIVKVKVFTLTINYTFSDQLSLFLSYSQTNGPKTSFASNPQSAEPSKAIFANLPPIMFLSVIIPAYNEEKRISKTLFSVADFLSKQNYESEILVVSDGSKDKTVEAVNGLKEQIKNLKMIDEAINQGKGWAVRRGMFEACGQIRLFMDADNSTTIDQINNFLPFFNQGYNVVIGSRRTKGAVIAVKQPWIRDFLGGIFRLIVHTLVPLGITDSQVGFKAFSQSTAEAIFKKQTIFRWAFDVEILAVARKLGFKIKEVPIYWVNDLESHVKISGMVKMLLEVLKVRWNLWRGKYNISSSSS